MQHFAMYMYTLNRFKPQGKVSWIFVLTVNRYYFCHNFTINIRSTIDIKVSFVFNYSFRKIVFVNLNIIYYYEENSLPVNKTGKMHNTNQSLKTTALNEIVDYTFCQMYRVSMQK